MHFAQHLELHPLPMHMPNEMMKKSECQDVYNNHLYEQIEFILTDRVIFPTEASTAEKRALIAKSNGYWQTQLRSINKYGELKVSKNCIWLAKSKILPQ